MHTRKVILPLFIFLSLACFVLGRSTTPPESLRHAVSLDGEHCVLGVDVGELEALSLSIWIKPQSVQPGETSIFSCMGWEPGALHFLLCESGNFNLSINGFEPDEFFSQGHIKPSVWNHLVVVIDGDKNTGQLYINGRPETLIEYRKTLPIELYDFYIGAWNEDPRTFRGEISDLRLFDRALTKAEITKLKQGSTSVSDPLLWWSFKQMDEEEIPDQSGHKHPGFLIDTDFENVEEDDEEEFEADDSPPPSFLPKSSQHLLSDPLINFDKLLFVKRYTYHSSHFYTDFIDGCGRYGGNLCVLDLETNQVTDLVPEMKDGIFGRYDLDFDACRIVFDWKKEAREGFRIYEIEIDPHTGQRTSGPRQITFPPADEAKRIAKYDNHQNGGTARMYFHQTDDMHPCYLPDGGIVFTSTRCEYSTLCDAPDHLTTAILYRVQRDGSRMIKLTNSALSEFSPTIMADGRILYTRWEYVDKGQLGVKCLWAMHPDGSGSVEIYGNNIQYPPSFLHGRQLPNSHNEFVMLGTPHYPQSGIGTVIRIDISKDIRTRAPMTYITPYVDIRQEPGWNQYTLEGWQRHTEGPLYMDPYPLSDKLYIVTFNPDQAWDAPRAYSLYLLDDQGHHQQVYQDPSISCWQPMPLRPRQKPPTLPSTINQELAQKKLAKCFVSDIYQGLEGIKRGDVKFIRVMEQVPRPWDCRQFWDGVRHTALISEQTALGAKVMHGIVPVYDDGSAHFYVPADRNIYFQVLDVNYMELQRERTYVNYRPGEQRSCMGCHEQSNRATRPTGPTMAMAKPALMPGPQPGDSTGQQVIHYESYVQPVLDRHCIRCHGENDPAGDLELTGTLTDSFSRSYENILERGLVKMYREASDWEGTAFMPPKSVGSHASPFISILREGPQHQELDLPLEDFVRLATWVDASAVYYGSYWGRRRLKYKDHPNFRPIPTFAEAIATQCPLPPEER